MPFHVVVDGHSNEIEFDYLSKNSGRRLEATLVPGRKKEALSQEIQTFVIEIMSKNLTHLDMDCSVEEALKIFNKNSIHHLPITKSGVLKGLISDRDILWLKKFDLTNYSKLSEFMSRTILCCEEDTPIDHLAKVMVNEKVSALPVVDKDSKLVGIVTHHDILRWIYDF